MNNVYLQLIIVALSCGIERAFFRALFIVNVNESALMSVAGAD